MGNSKRKRKNGAMPIRDGRFHGRSGLAPRLGPPPRGRAGNNVPLRRQTLPAMEPDYRAVAEENLRENRCAGVCFTLPPAYGIHLVE